MGGYVGGRWGGGRGWGRCGGRGGTEKGSMGDPWSTGSNGEHECQGGIALLTREPVRPTILAPRKLKKKKRSIMIWNESCLKQTKSRRSPVQMSTKIAHPVKHG